jgi:hypothetical protein
MDTSEWRGHKIHCVNDVWFYSDNNKKVSDDTERQCGHCEAKQTKEGHDACLGELPGLMNACCGHGDGDPSIQFYDRFIITGKDAKKIINILKKYKRESNLTEKQKQKVCKFIGKKIKKNQKRNKKQGGTT